MPSTDWYVGSNLVTANVYVVTSFSKDAQTTISTPKTYTINSLQWYAAAEVPGGGIYIKTELYVGSTLVARTTEREVTTNAMQAFSFTRTSHNDGGPWVYTVTGNTTFTFRIWFRSGVGGMTCMYRAWQNAAGDYVPYGVINVSYPESGAKVWNGSSWVKRPVKVWDGSSWVRRPVKVRSGSSWVTH